MMRLAIVKNAESAKKLYRYMPANYVILGGIDGEYLIGGYDEAGWTLDGYVIPRLASGLIWATEVTDNQEVVLGFLREQEVVL